MKASAPGSFGAQLKALREAAGFTQEELATIAGLSVHAVSALERGERRRPHADTVRALSNALDLTGPSRAALLGSARSAARVDAIDETVDGLVPLPLTSLVGRGADLDLLRQWLADPAARLVTLLGPGGVGKTRLALELARAIQQDGRTRVVFVPLASLCDPTFVGPSIAEALGLSNVMAVDLPARVRAACDSQPTLLVLDNCEHVLDAAPLVAEVLAATPGLRLLVTSRAPLRIRGEREFAVGPLALEVTSSQPSLTDLGRMPAVQLFVDRAREVRPEFQLTEANGGTVAAICHKLDALPLALELAARWMKVLSPEDLRRQLERDVLLSTAGPRDLPERQQTMSATVGWSYQLLDPFEQRTFRRLAVLAGRFPLEAAAAVLAPDAEPAMAVSAAAALIDKSLLVRADTASTEGPHYQMLETIRAYAGVELSAKGERDEAMEGLVRYCAGESSRAASGLVGLDQAEWLDRVRDDLEHYRVVLGWLLERNRPADACDIAWRLMFFWVIRGSAAEGLQWYERCLNAESLAPETQGRALVGAAVMLFTQGERARARTAVTQALMSARLDREIAVMATHLLGHVEQADGNLQAAGNLFASSIEGFGALHTPWGVGNALIGKAGVSIATGDIAEGERLLDEASAVLQHAGPWFLNLPLYIRAILAVRQGHADEAITLVRQSLVCSRRLHDKFAFVYALTPLAAAAALKGDDAWAARILGTRDAVIERIGTTSVDRSVIDLRERTERDVRTRLGSDRWTSAHAAGRTASLETLLNDIERATARH